VEDRFWATASGVWHARGYRPTKAPWLAHPIRAILHKSPVQREHRPVRQRCAEIPPWSSAALMLRWATGVCKGACPSMRLWSVPWKPATGSAARGIDFGHSDVQRLEPGQRNRSSRPSSPNASENAFPPDSRPCRRAPRTPRRHRRSAQGGRRSKDIGVSGPNTAPSATAERDTWPDGERLRRAWRVHRNTSTGILQARSSALVVLPRIMVRMRPWP
jgi:hypothetical protein